MTTTFTAVAHPNIALIKYWGKSDEELILPASPSFSMTLDAYPTTTTVRLDATAAEDSLFLDGRAAGAGQRARVSAFLDLVRQRAGRRERVVVESRNTVPTGAGLASSAAGFAALAGAASAAFGLDLDLEELSRLARRGSGSASRSVYPGFALWRTGDDAGSYAEGLDAGDLDAALVIVVLNDAAKAVSSRVAMRATAETSPFYSAWLQASNDDLDQMLAAFEARDLDGMGQVAERNALRMHASMLGAVPPIRYLGADSFAVLDAVAALRAEGLTAYATMDAGPNVKVLCPAGQASRIAEALARVVPAASIITAGMGPGVRVYSGETAGGPGEPAADPASRVRPRTRPAPDTGSGVAGADGQEVAR